jgi:hypothetical protein
MDYDPDRANEILASTPEVLRVMLGHLSDAWTLDHYSEEEWSAFDVVGHLVHAEKTDWIARIRRILEDGTAVAFTPFDRFAQFEESKGKTMHELLDAFAVARAANLQVVSEMGLGPEHWDLEGLHPALGTVTLRNLLATWVAHDMNHLAQICESLARHYDAAVGPWRRFLPIIDRSAMGN